MFFKKSSNNPTSDVILENAAAARFYVKSYWLQSSFCGMGHLHLILLPTAAIKVSSGEELPKLFCCAELGQNV